MAAIQELKERVELLTGGVQIQSKKKNGIGTLGCVVFDKLSGKPLGLTNRHILKKRRGFSVIQPAAKSRTGNYLVGKILRKGRRGRSSDYAVFELDINNRDYDKENSIYGLKGKLSEIAIPVEGMKVQKVGQRTGHTYGIVENVEGNTITIKPNPDKPTEEISQGGDSGALWLTDEEDFKAVGLHRAGESDDNPNLKDRAYAIPITRVFKALNVRF